MTNSRLVKELLRDEKGFTLIESLVSLAVATVIILTLSSFFSSTMTVQRLLRQNTRGYDQVRVAFDTFVDDARFARGIACDPLEFMKITPTATTSRYYFMYLIKPSDDGTQYNLHREVWVPNGASSRLERDDIVGWDVVEPYSLQLDAEGSGVFRCNNTGGNRLAQLYLEKAPTSPTEPNTALQVMAYLRTR